jgi:hypothetical protein
MPETFFFVMPSSHGEAFRNIFLAQNIRGYDNLGEAEKVGNPVHEGEGGQNRIITGSSRATSTDVDDLCAENPWLEVVTEWPSDWVWLEAPE